MDIQSVEFSAYVFGATYEVADWLGFKDADEYLKALPIERERIFERARY